MEENQGNQKSHKINCSYSEFAWVFPEMTGRKPRAMNDLHGA